MRMFAKFAGRIFLSALLPAALLAAGCAGGKKPAVVTAAKGDVVKGSLTAIDVNDTQDEIQITVSATSELKPNVFRLSDPPKVIIDLPDTTLGEVKGPISVNNDFISEINLNQFDDAAGSLSRIVIALNRYADYQIQTDGNKLALKILKKAIGEEDETALSAEGVPEEKILGEEFVPTEEGKDLPQANAILDVSREDMPEAVTFRLSADGKLPESIDDFVLSDPARIVVDIPGVSNKYPGGGKIEVNDDNIKDVRLGEHDGKLRVVFDLKSDNAPSYTLDTKGQTLVVTIVKSSPVGEDVAESVKSADTGSSEDIMDQEVAGEKIAEPSPIPEETVDEILPESEFPGSAKVASAGEGGSEESAGTAAAEGEQEAGAVPAENAAQEPELAGAAEEPAVAELKGENVAVEPESGVVAEEAPTAPGEETAVEEEAALAGPEEEVPVESEEAELPPSPSVKLSKLEFHQVKDKNTGKPYSRITLKTDGPVSYEERMEDGRWVMELPGTSVPPAYRRQLDTSAFGGPVKKVSAVEQDGSSAIIVELSSPVKPRVSQEGDVINIDFENPVVAPRKPSVEEGAALAAAEVSFKDDESIDEEIGEEPGADEVVAGTDLKKGKKEGAEDELSYLEEETVSPEERYIEYSKPKKGRYDYVTETIIRDTRSGIGSSGTFYTESSTTRKVWRGRRINLNFKNADIRSIFRLLADISKLNIIVSDDVQGTVTVRLMNVPWDQAMAIILESKGLGAVKMGNIIRIAPADQLKKERELAAAARKAAEQAEELELMLLPVSYATAEDMSERVKSVLTERGKVDVDTRTNTLIIRDIRSALEKAKALVKSLDTQTPQVSIEARIVEATTNYTKAFGIQWGAVAKFGSSTGNPTGVFFPNSVTAQGNVDNGATTTVFGTPIALNYPSNQAPNAAMALRLGSINGVVDLDLQLGLLENSGQGKIISSPKVTVLDNESATIMQGTKIPFITQTSNSGSNVRFENAVVSLEVTPHVTADGAVFMQVTATRNFPDYSNAVQGNPTIQMREATTKVLVKSGNTTVIGGVYSLTKTDSKSGFPYLSRIPIIGWLFRSMDKVRSRQELLVFITPRIVGDERRVVKDIRS